MKAPACFVGVNAVESMEADPRIYQRGRVRGLGDSSTPVVSRGKATLGGFGALSLKVDPK